MTGPRLTPGLRRYPALALILLAVALVLFEVLFLDASILSFDNRLVPPLRYHVRGDETPRPMNLVTGDINAWHVPDALLSLERLGRGELPLWNERQALGHPLLASMGFVTFYPSALLHLFLDPLRAIAVSVALHLMLLGAGTLFYCRRRGLSEPAALLAAFATTFSAFASLHVHLQQFLSAFAWLPWILLAGERLVERCERRRIAVLALAIGACLLAGAPQIAALCIWAGAALAIARTRRLRALLAWAGGSLLGVALASVLLLPGAELYSESARSQAPASSPLEPECLLGFVLPRIFGDPVQEISVVTGEGRRVEDFPSVRSWLEPGDENNLVDNAVQFGLIPFVLALLALARPGSGTARAHTGLFLVSLLAASGVPGIAHALGVLPGIGIGSPKRVLCLTAFAGAVLAGCALERLGSGRRSSSPAWLLVPGVLLCLLAGSAVLPFEGVLLPDASADELSWFRDVLLRDLRGVGAAGATLLIAALLLLWRRTGPAVILLLASSGLELCWQARAGNPPQTREKQYSTTPAIDWLVAETTAAPARVLSFHMTEALPGCLAQVFGLRSYNGYHPLLNRATRELYEAIEPGTMQVGDRVIGAVRRLETLRSPLLDLVGVRYVATSVAGHRRIQAGELEGLRLVYRNEKELLAIYERASALQSAFLVRRARVLPARAERLARLAADGFDPREEVLLETEVPGTGSFASGTVRYERPCPERIVLHVDAEGPAFVVVSETHFPGWVASVEGQALPLHRADHALMGIAVPPGKHRVELEYRPLSFTLGAVLSICAALVVGILLLCRRRVIEEPEGS